MSIVLDLLAYLFTAPSSYDKKKKKEKDAWASS